MKQLPCNVVMLTNDRHFEPGVQVASDLGEYVRLLTNLGVTYDASHSKADEWLSEHGRIAVGITPSYSNVYGYGAVVERGEINPCEEMPNGLVVDAYLLGLTKHPTMKSDGLGHQMFFIMPVLAESKHVAMWVQPPHALGPDDSEQLDRYPDDMMQFIKGRPADERLLDVPMAPVARGMIN